MKKKKFAFLICACVLLFAAGCNEDKGNYDYRPVESMLPLEISLPDPGNDNQMYYFDVFSMVELTPEIKPVEGYAFNEADYDYLWYAYSLRNNDVDTLSRELKATFMANFPVNSTFKLVFEVKNRQTGIFARVQMDFTTVSEISRGWFVLKDQDDMTDMDIILPDGTLMPDVISKSLGHRMEGRAVKMIFHPSYSYKTESGGYASDKQAYQVLSQQDMNTFQTSDMSLLKSYEDQFYLLPETRAPQDIAIGYREWSGTYMMITSFLLNGGGVSGFAGVGPNYSQFDYARMGPKTVYPKMVCYSFLYGNAMVYDQESCTFYMATTNDLKMGEAPDHEDNPPYDSADPSRDNPLYLRPFKMNADMVWMDQVEDNSNMIPGNVTGWALMKTRPGHRDYPDYKLIKLRVSGSKVYPFDAVYDIADTRGLISADVREPMQGNEAIYFAKGNLLYYYQRAGNSDQQSRENLIYTFPGNETVTFISNLQSATDRLVVCTGVGGKWKLYIFKTKYPVPDIDSEVEPEVFTGDGTARCVIYRP